MQLRNFKKSGNGSGNNAVPSELANNPAFNAAMQKYGGMGEDALIEQLLNQINTAKQKGTYNPTQMQTYIQMLSPHLSETQRTKLQNLLKVIHAQDE